MAVVLALMIVGWLIAFALGAQAGFDPQAAESPESVSQSQAAQPERVDAYASSVSSLAQ
jgi:hypothetical protein